ncbi:unnamed protein product [Effrenium voratum]|nr:unnamed protein product [Effrenium voratum]
MKTLEQQKLYEGDFSLLVKEVTEDGAIVQDVTTGVFGFLPNERSGAFQDKLIPGDTVQGARCTYLDTTIIQSPDPSMLRMQTGVVFEWDEANGEGFIIPSEEQDAYRMLRVVRRDIKWHDSRRLFPGQFVQFDTALPHEVPVPSQLDAACPVALRVRGLEVVFSLEEAYELIPQGSTEPLLLEAPSEPSESDEPESNFEEPEPEGTMVRSTQAQALAERPGRTAFPVMPGRPKLAAQKKTHPLLQRFAQKEPQLAEAESPSWLWEPHLEYLKEERYDPIVPVQLKQMPVKPKRKRILVHEEALKRGDTWQEGAMRKHNKLWNKMKPPGREQQELRSRRHMASEKGYRLEQIRRAKWKLSEQQKAERRAALRS